QGPPRHAPRAEVELYSARMPNLSVRARSLAASPIRKLASLAAAAEMRGTTVLHLNIGQPDIETPRELRDKLASLPKVIEYSPSEGTPEYLAVLQHYYARLGLPLGAGDILGTAGASEALLFALQVVTDPGDDVIIPEPFYTNYATFAK